jgi:capsular polysaccharide biosynthesis protein
MSVNPRDWGARAVYVLVPAIALGLLVGGYLATRPASYEADVTLLATPADTPKAGGVEFGSVVNLTLPGMTAIARSRSLLKLVRAQVPGAPPLTELSKSISVQVIPASGIAQLSVTADSPALAAALAKALGGQVISADLLAPVGRFRLTDNAPVAHKVAPDRHLAVGLGLVAALLVGAVILGAGAALSPRIMSDRDVKRVLDWLEVAVIDLRSSSGAASLHAALGPNPDVTVIPVGDHAQLTYERVLQLLPTQHQVQLADPSRMVIVAVGRGDASRAELRNAVVMSYVAGWRLLAVVVV